MEENKDLVAEQVAENVEDLTTEETPKKMYSQDEVDKIVGTSKARAKAQVEKKYQRKYGRLENVLRAGTGKESIEEITDIFAEHYESRGVELDKKPSYSQKDIETLANADATDIINSGYDYVVDEIERLSEVGFENMTPREKAYFQVLAEHRQKANRQQELSKLGVTEDVINSKEFKDFAKQFNSDTPIANIYKLFTKTQPKKEIKTMGSMKSTASNETKDFYSPEEINKMTVDDLKDPKVWDAVRRSMTGVK